MTRIGLVAATFALLDPLTYLQIVAALVTVVGVLAIGRVRQKDATIKDLDSACASKDERIKETNAQLDGAQARANAEHELRRECEKSIAGLERELAVVQQFTAEGALKDLKQIIERVASESTERAIQTMERQERIERMVINAVANQGELVLKNTEMVARLLQHLGAPG